MSNLKTWHHLAKSYSQLCKALKATDEPVLVDMIKQLLDGLQATKEKAVQLHNETAQEHSMDELKQFKSRLKQESK